MTMYCTDVRGRLHGYLDEELERSSVVELEENYDRSPLCAAAPVT